MPKMLQMITVILPCRPFTNPKREMKEVFPEWKEIGFKKSLERIEFMDSENETIRSKSNRQLVGVLHNID